MSTTSQNANLVAARKKKNDEFYTQTSDIEKELRHYKHYFKSKVVYCNCDDPKVSNFFRYFYRNFEYLQLKELVSVCYKNQNPDIFTQNKSKKSVYIVCDGRVDANGKVTKLERRLKKDGDFRNEECINLLQQADIVVTNPPFSLFREYIAQLIQYDKKFIVIGNHNAVTYKDIFPLIKAHKLWLGASPRGMSFRVPDDSETYSSQENGIKYNSVNAAWYTNLDIAKRHQDLILYKKYAGNESDYITYDNYDAIEVSKVNEIPADYEGVMGVPISFMDKHNPEQFKILGSNRGVDQDPNRVYGRGCLINGTEVFKRIFIKNKRLQS